MSRGCCCACELVAVIVAVMLRVQVASARQARAKTNMSINRLTFITALRSFDDLVVSTEKRSNDSAEESGQEVLSWKRKKEATLKEGQIWMSKDGFVEGKMPKKKGGPIKGLVRKNKNH